MKIRALLVVVAIFALVQTSCGSSDSGNTGGGTTNETAAASVAQSTLTMATGYYGLAANNLSVPPSLRKHLSATVDCDSGTLTYNSDDVTGDLTFTANDCVLGGDTMNGSFAFSMVDETSLVMSYTDFSVTYDGITSTIDGDMTITVEGDVLTIVYDDLSGSLDSDTFSISGTLSFDSSTELVSGDVTFVINGETVSCSFDDFNVETASESDWNNACSL